MNIPSSIVIFGFEIKTQYDTTLLADRERYGEYCSRTMTITLDSNLSEQRKALAYCHELVEATVDISHITMEEQDKQAMGLMLYQVIQAQKV